jgi:hypothetical protein
MNRQLGLLGLVLLALSPGCALAAPAVGGSGHVTGGKGHAAAGSRSGAAVHRIHHRSGGNHYTSSYYYGGSDIDPRLRRQGYQGYGYGYGYSGDANDAAPSRGLPGLATHSDLKKGGQLDKNHPKGYTEKTKL